MDVKCPKCGGETTIRTRSKDGRKFYACVRYPECKGLVAQDKVDSQGQKPSRSKKPIIIAAIIVPILIIAGIVAAVVIRGSSSPTTQHTHLYSECALILDMTDTWYEAQTYSIEMNHVGVISGEIAAGDDLVQVVILNPLYHQVYWNFGSGNWQFDVDANLAGNYTLILEDNSRIVENILVCFSVWKEE